MTYIEWPAGLGSEFDQQLTHALSRRSFACRCA